MHEIQKRLLALAQIEDIESFSYRQTAERIGCEHASQVKHHLEQLVKHGYLVRNSMGRLLAMSTSRQHDSNVLTIPIMGEADCGEATRYATNKIAGYLSVSPSLVRGGNVSDLFALKACGDSMNDARVDGTKPIEDGDYILVKQCSLAEVIDGDYVVSIIQGLANVKKFMLDSRNQRIVLIPESREPGYAPIIIADEDVIAYEVSGKVVDVIQRVPGLA